MSKPPFPHRKILITPLKNLFLTFSTPLPRHISEMQWVRRSTLTTLCIKQSVFKRPSCARPVCPVYSLLPSPRPVHQVLPLPYPVHQGWSLFYHGFYVGHTNMLIASRNKTTGKERKEFRPPLVPILFSHPLPFHPPSSWWALGCLSSLHFGLKSLMGDLLSC